MSTWTRKDSSRGPGLWHRLHEKAPGQTLCGSKPRGVVTTRKTDPDAAESRCAACERHAAAGTAGRYTGHRGKRS